jgi:hypothetical protein
VIAIGQVVARTGIFTRSCSLAASLSVNGLRHDMHDSRATPGRPGPLLVLGKDSTKEPPRGVR